MQIATLRKLDYLYCVLRHVAPQNKIDFKMKKLLEIKGSCTILKDSSYKKECYNYKYMCI